MTVPIGGEGFNAQVGELGVYFYSPMTDSIHVFEDTRLNHVHFFDQDEGRMMFQFLGQAALDDLHEAGIPHTVRDSITQYEYEQWEDWQVDNEREELEAATPEMFSNGSDDIFE